MSEPIPTFFEGDHVGRYEILEEVGDGAFGRVYRAFDPILDRQIALKIPKKCGISSTSALRDFITEGRALAQLSHDAIIEIHYVDITDDKIPFVDMEFVDGSNLKKFVASTQPDLLSRLRIVKQIAEGLGEAHDHKIVHRDLKPSNILIDQSGNVRIADFGLALDFSEPIKATKHAIVGTWEYMAPEQLNGEDHHMDGRTDIWAIGVTLYWLMSGEKPFKGTEFEELKKVIFSEEPPSLLEHNRLIPVEIDRICNKCLQKTMDNRYPSTDRLIADLQFVIDHLESQLHDPETTSFATETSGGHDQSATASNGTSIQSQTTPNQVGFDSQIVPKGMRSFDGSDSEFYLNMLPGPKDRHGFPDSIRFWIEKITNMDPIEPVGLIYGPSGCGKSSFVRAGLLPRLDEFETIYIEASSNLTIETLTHVLRSRIPGTEQASLTEILAQIRGNKTVDGRRWLIVVDQLEQWLHTDKLDLTSELVAGLRQADGYRLQFLLLVRDDYWMPVQQLFSLLETGISEGRNALAFELFNEKHSINVLAALGQAYGQFPFGKLTKKHLKFLREAVKSLSNQGKVICGHLALFAESMRDRQWNIEELKKAGGWQGAATQYLRAQFSKDAKSRLHREFHRQTRDFLAALLPELGVNLKKSGLTRSELIAVCPSIDENNFDAIVEILEQRERLVTRTDEYDEVTYVDKPRFRLTHDVLIGPIRQWLELEQRESWRGRANLTLKEYVAQKRAMPNTDFVPGFFEFLSIWFGVPQHQRTEEGNQILQKAFQKWSIRSAVVAAVIASFLSLGIYAATRPDGSERIVENFQEFMRGQSEIDKDKFNELIVNTQIVTRELQNFDAETPRQKFRKMMLTREIPLRFSSSPQQLDQENYFESLETAVSFLPEATPAEFQYFTELVREESAANGHSLHKKIAKKVDNEWSSSSSTAKIRYAIFTANISHHSNPNQFDRIFEVLKCGRKDRIITTADPVLDPTDRNLLYCEFPKFWDGNARLLFTTGMQTVGMIKVDIVYLMSMIFSRCSEDLQLEMIEAMKSIYLSSSFVLEDSGMLVSDHSAPLHSAAKFFLQKHAELPINSEKVGDPKLSDWYVMPTDIGNITMLKMPAGSFVTGIGLGERYDAERSGRPRNQVVSVKPFWMADSEISIKQFKLYCSAKGIPLSVATSQPESYRSDEAPILSVTPKALADYLNWLSAQDGFDPAIRFVRRNIEPGGNVNGFVFAMDLSKNGYRLPTCDELIFATRAGTETRSFVGNFELTSEVAQLFIPIAPDYKPMPVLSGIPNQFGFWYLIGNANEYAIEPVSQRLQIHESGTVFAPSNWELRGSRFPERGPWGQQGFRPVRSAIE